MALPFGLAFETKDFDSSSALACFLRFSSRTRSLKVDLRQKNSK